MKIKRLPNLEPKQYELNIGRYVKLAREECGLSQRELAELLGHTSGAYVALKESNERKVSIDELVRIAHHTNQPIRYFIYGKIFSN